MVQSFVATESRLFVSFDLFVNDWSGVGPLVNPAGLDFTADPNQHARVDILTGGANALSTAPGDVVDTLFLGVDPQFALPNPFQSYTMLVSGLTKGDTYQIRFGEVDNQFFLTMGVDNVRIYIPEPGSLMLLGLGAVGMVASRSLRRRWQ